MFDKKWLERDFDSCENFRGETTYFVPEKRLLNARDQLLGITEELLMSPDPDMKKVESCIEELAYSLGMRLPSYVS